MAPKRLLICCLLLATCQVLVRPAGATAIANSTLNFSNLSIMPAVGVLDLDGPWLLGAIANANNSLGNTDERFVFAFSPGMVTVTAEVPWATATGVATAPGDPPDLKVGGSALSSVNVPGCDPAAAFATGIGLVSNSFTLSGSGSVAVQFGIDIDGVLKVMTDACGIEAVTETIFTLAVDGGDPILFDHEILSIGPSDSRTRPVMRHLTNTVFLAAGVDDTGMEIHHFLILQADSESRGRTAPEPSAIALMLVAFCALLCIRRRALEGSN